MTINLTNVAKNTATTKFFYGDDEGSVTYRPSEYTEANLNKLGPEFGLAEYLVMLLVDWDVVEGTKAKPTKVPLTLERIKTLPIDFQRGILKAITHDGEESVGEAVDS